MAIVILSCNNESHIAETLRSCVGFAPVYVIDSGSSDSTPAICTELGATFSVNTMQVWDAGAQRNHIFGVLNERYRWVLFLDSDEILEEGLKDELVSFVTKDEGNYDAAAIRSLYHLGGYPLNAVSRDTFHDRLVSTALELPIFTRSPGEVLVGRSNLRIKKFDAAYRHNVDAKGWRDWISRIFVYAFRNGSIDAEFLMLGQRRDVKNFSSIRRLRIVFFFLLPILYLSYYLIKRKAYKDGVCGILFAILMSSAYLAYPIGFLFCVLSRKK